MGLNLSPLEIIRTRKFKARVKCTFRFLRFGIPKIHVHCTWFLYCIRLRIHSHTMMSCNTNRKCKCIRLYIFWLNHQTSVFKLTSMEGLWSHCIIFGWERNIIHILNKHMWNDTILHNEIAEWHRKLRSVYTSYIGVLSFVSQS